MNFRKKKPSFLALYSSQRIKISYEGYTIILDIRYLYRFGAQAVSVVLGNGCKVKPCAILHVLMWTRVQFPRVVWYSYLGSGNFCL